MTEGRSTGGEGAAGVARRRRWATGPWPWGGETIRGGRRRRGRRRERAGPSGQRAAALTGSAGATLPAHSGRASHARAHADDQCGKTARQRPSALGCAVPRSARRCGLRPPRRPCQRARGATHAKTPRVAARRRASAHRRARRGRARVSAHPTRTLRARSRTRPERRRARRVVALRAAHRRCSGAGPGRPPLPRRRRGRGALGARDDLPLRAAPLGRLSARAAHPSARRVRRSPVRSRSRRCASAGSGALALALLCFAFAAGVLLVPVRGHTLEQWAPVTVRFLLGRYSSRARFHSQRAQLGHVVALPTGRPRPAAPAGAVGAARRAGGPRVPRGRARAVRGRPLRCRQGSRAHARSPRRCACAGARSRCSAPAEREQRLADYGAVLAALARDGSAVRRIAWIERTLPGDGDELGDYLLQAKRPDASLAEPPEELVSYLSADRPRRRRRRGTRADASRCRSTPSAPPRDARSRAWAAETSARSRCSPGKSGS